MKKTIDLPVSVEEKDAMILALQAENSLLKQKYHFILEQFKLVQQRKFARSSESNVLQGVFPHSDTLNQLNCQNVNSIVLTLRSEARAECFLEKLRHNKVFNKIASI